MIVSPEFCSGIRSSWNYELGATKAVAPTGAVVTIRCRAERAPPYGCVARQGTVPVLPQARHFAAPMSISLRFAGSLLPRGLGLYTEQSYQCFAAIKVVYVKLSK